MLWSTPSGKVLSYQQRPAGSGGLEESNASEIYKVRLRKKEADLARYF
ncbi:hypothetical protein BLL52_0357 [Rhodoferax antarcticus ANT.BR]|uniref:Uncharacterized protein n=1 Tax=Rhodoferax antarcticus ANT.BR TaxID=1111071 RepID=A0A1Q8YK60_9BURK|nr:hypothetical protein BLL52_0357 [Rhodoferax antarcticus ANT.BR]